MFILETKCLPGPVTVSIEAHTKIEISQNNANKPFSKTEANKNKEMGKFSIVVKL